MAWLASLAPVVGGCLLAGGAWAAFRRARRGKPAPTTPDTTNRALFAQGEFKAVDPAEVEHAADQALQLGDVELAANLFERAGMLLRAMELYRRIGNISKVAELEIMSLDLGRSAVMPVLKVGTANDTTAESPRPEIQPLLLDAMVFEADDIDDDDMRATLPPATRQQGRAVVPAQHVSEHPRLISEPPRMISERPRLLSERPHAAEPKRMSERPRNAGPSIESLKRMLGSSPTPDLGNIEIFYRLALAYVAHGQHAEAREAFLTVEDVSPGYRDTARYLEQLGAVKAPEVPAEARTPKRSGPFETRPNPSQPMHSSPAAKKRGYVEEVAVPRNRVDNR